MALKKGSVRGKIIDKANGHSKSIVAAPLEGEVISLPEITKQEEKFVGHYAIFANGVRACEHAQYDQVALNQKAYEILTRSDIQAHIKHARSKLGELHFDVANSIIRQLDLMRNADITKIYDENGYITDPQEWPEGIKLLLKGVETEEHMTGEGDAGIMVRTKKVTFDTRRQVMETMAKILGILQPDGSSAQGAVPQTVIWNITVGEPPK